MGANRKSSNGKFELLAAAVIRKRREELKMLQPELAAKVGLNRKNISDIETGVVHLHLTHLATICPGLGWSISDLILETERQTKNPGALIRDHQFSQRKQVVIEIPPAPEPSKVRRAAERAQKRALKQAGSLPLWLGGLLPLHLKEQHASSADELRRRNLQRDSEDSPELCEVDEG